MISVIFNVISVLLVIVGLVDVLRVIVLYFLSTKDDRTQITLIPICGHNEETELLLRTAIAHVKWLDGTIKKHHIICVDLGMDDETREIAHKISQEYNFVDICTADELQTTLKCAN